MSFWISGSSTGHIAFSDVLADILDASANSVSAAAINSGGSGYAEGDILTVAGGTATITAQIEVTSVSGGVIDGIRIYNSGSYTSNPTTTANAVTGGTGSSATIDLTMDDVGWVVDSETAWSGSEKQVIAHGTGAGSDTIYVGWRTFSDVGNDYYNWEIHGLTGYTAGLGVEEQPGSSPGDHTGANDAERCGSYLPLINTSFNWWINVNPYRIIISANISTSYMHAYMGWGNRIGTSTEYPYPMYISTPAWTPYINSSDSGKFSSITDPWVGSYIDNDFAMGTTVYEPGGGWTAIVNRRSTSIYNNNVVVPTGRPTGVSTSPSFDIDRFMNTGYGSFDDFIYSTSSGSGGSTTGLLLPTGSNDDRLLLPCYVVLSETKTAILLEIDECRWCNNYGGVTSEDRLIESGGQAWRIFQNGNRPDTYAYIAIKEAS